MENPPDAHNSDSSHNANKANLGSDILNMNNSQSVLINGALFEWDPNKGNLSFFGVDATLFWTDPSLVFMFTPIVEELGIDLFRLLVANSSSYGTDEGYESMVSTLADNFRDGFIAWGDAVALCGWGKFTLHEYDPDRCHAVIQVDNPWELALQKNVESQQRWGCPFLQGKVIGIFEKALKQTCWVKDECEYLEDGTSRVILNVYASDKTIDKELSRLRQEKLSEHEKQLQQEIDEKTVELQKSNVILENIAKLDFLTNLNNRRSLEQQLLHIKYSETWDQHILMFVDLDQFKVINDTCGHLSGDRLLTIVGEQLINCVGREEHLVYRYGGDEFTVLLKDAKLSFAVNLAHKIRKAISNIRFDWDGRIYQINCSIGLIALDTIAPEVDTAIIAADNACYQAKIKGRNQVYVSAELETHVENRLSQMNWVHKIKEAINNDRFEVHFQIIKPLNGDETIALEALIRMVDDDGSLIMPFKFLPAAEHYDVIFEVDCWVINHVFKKLQEAADNDYLESIAINLSGNTLSNPKLEGFIDHCFAKYKVDPKKICFELTETHMMMNLDTAKAILLKLRKHGCTVSLDDFGAGMSSFGYLRDLPIDKIKIDGSFVKNMAESMVDYTFVESITNVAKAMNIKTVAEFVENERIIELLEDLMVDYAQGYCIARPQPWDEIFPS